MLYKVIKAYKQQTTTGSDKIRITSGFIDYRNDWGKELPPSSLWYSGFSPSGMGKPGKAMGTGVGNHIAPHVKVIQHLYSCSDHFYITSSKKRYHGYGCSLSHDPSRTTGT